MQKYYDTFKQFPPAAVIGPDGKPWHSWPVRLLPFLDQHLPYFKYRFDEPWNGPNNVKLLDPIPGVYSDQPNGQAADHFTRYAAVTGKGMLFSAEGVRFDGGKKLLLRAGTGTTKPQITDGDSLAFGTLSPDHKIPWTKPDDIVLGEMPAGIGMKGGYGTPYKSEKGNLAFFVRVDGEVTRILDTIDPKVFHSMLTIAGKEPLDWSKLESAFVPQIAAPLTAKSPVIYLYEEDGQTKACFTP